MGSSWKEEGRTNTKPRCGGMIKALSRAADEGVLIYHPKGEGEMGLKLPSGQATVTNGSISYPSSVLRSQKG